MSLRCIVFLIAILCFPTILHAGDLSHSDAGLRQYPMRAVKSNYRLEQQLFSGMIGIAGRGARGEVLLTLETVPAPDGTYMVSCVATAGRQVIPGVGRPVQSALWKCISTVDSKCSVSKEEIVELGTQSSNLSVEMRDSTMFGISKVITSRKDGEIIRELMIGKDEIVTTLFQVAVFVGTIASLPQEGMKIRWVLNGMPHPMVVTRNTNELRSFIISRDDLATNSEAETLRLRFDFGDGRDNFSLPSRIVFIAEGRQLEIVGMED